MPVRVLLVSDVEEVFSRTRALARDGFTCTVDPREGSAVCLKRYDHEVYYTVIVKVNRCGCPG